MRLREGAVRESGKKNVRTHGPFGADRSWERFAARRRLEGSCRCDGVRSGPVTRSRIVTAIQFPIGSKYPPKFAALPL